MNHNGTGKPVNFGTRSPRQCPTTPAHSAIDSQDGRTLRPALFAALVLIAGCRPGVSAPSPASAIAADINILASPGLAGRATGTAGADSAAEFIARRYEQLALRPAFHFRCGSAVPCPASYFQQFRIDRGVAQNVGAIADGSDTSCGRSSW